MSLTNVLRPTPNALDLTYEPPVSLDVAAASVMAELNVILPEGLTSSRTGNAVVLHRDPSRPDFSVRSETDPATHVLVTEMGISTESLDVIRVTDALRLRLDALVGRAGSR